jgi:molybdopterin molybdotransferase
MVEIRKPILPFEAIAKIIERVPSGRVERIPLSNANQRFLAQDIVADHPIPSFDRSSFDGYAIRSFDTNHASSEQAVRLRVIESIAAGEVAHKKVDENEAIRIMTGAQMPEGANAVIGLEFVRGNVVDGVSYIEFNQPVEVGSNVVYTGEDTQAGTILAKKGRRITAGEMAMLATFGYDYVKVFQRPTVGIFVTGTELLPVDAPLTPGKIRNSNSYMLLAQIESLGACPKYYGILADDFDLCFESVQKALMEVDFLITTGGASVGDFDFVQDIVQKLEAEILFNKVAMRPGSVTTVAKKDEKWIFGLSGNPSACYVGFEMFARPVLKAALGSKHLQLPISKAVLTHDIPMANSFTRYVRAKVELRGGQVEVRTIGVDKSGMASTLIEANALLVIPSGPKGAIKGDLLEVIWLERSLEGYTLLT